jgi:DNA-binding XRE family transcriptional regulator
MSLRVTLRTRDTFIEIRGAIPGTVLEVLRKEYGRRLIARCDWVVEQLPDILNAPLYEQDPQQMSPAAYLRFFRQDNSLTQAELGLRLGGLSRQHISDMENGRRSVGRAMARKLSKLFKVALSKFIE